MHRLARPVRLVRSIRLPRTVRLLGAVLAVALTAALAVLASGAAVSASTLHMAAGASRSHPFSDPVWYPLRGSYAVLACDAGGPGCTPEPAAGDAAGPDDALTLLSRRLEDGTPVYTAQPVYAAGAGILHIGANVGDECQSPASIGTWVWIDHGGGVTSRYGHLDGILSSVHAGEHVTPSTVIGYTGRSGEDAASECTQVTHSLNFRVTHGGVYGRGVLPPTLKACENGVAAPFLRRAAGARTFQQQAQEAVLDNSGQSPTACVGKPAAHTTRAPVTTSLRRHGKGVLKLTWKRPTHILAVQLLLEKRRPATHTWTVVKRHTIRVGRHVGASWRFRKLTAHRLYRARLAFKTSAGWSAYSAPRTARAS